MILFRTLGAAELEEDLEARARPIAIQAKRLALLAYVALAGRGRHRRRDSTVALSWPDLDEEHARSALRQSLTYLRRTLGPRAVVTRGEEEIAIDPDALRCDAVQFDEAVAAGKLEDAMALYQGEFLDGLFVSDASPELGHWIDAERSRLRQAAATCGSSLAEMSWQRGDGVSAARWARVAVSLGPDDERKLRWLVTLLDSIGDRAGALEAHGRVARRLASEYSAEPSAETKALMSAVRSRSAAQRDEQTLTPLPPAPERARPSADARASPLPSPNGRVPARRYVALVAVALALAFAVVLGSTRRRAELAPRATVAVLPSEDPGADSTSPYLADALTDQLITSLARSRELLVINRRTMMTFRGSAKRPSDIARGLDADVALTSAVRRVGDSLRLTVQLVRADDARISWAWSASTASRDLLRLAERVADSVAEHTLGTSRTAERMSLDTARGVDPIALHSYIEGRYWWNKRGPGLLRSIGIFTTALDRDPTFALAYSGMGDAYVQLG